MNTTIQTENTTLALESLRSMLKAFKDFRQQQFIKRLSKRATFNIHTIHIIWKIMRFYHSLTDHCSMSLFLSGVDIMLSGATGGAGS